MQKISLHRNGILYYALLRRIVYSIIRVGLRSKLRQGDKNGYHKKYK